MKQEMELKELTREVCEKANLASSVITNRPR